MSSCGARAQHTRGAPAHNTLVVMPGRGAKGRPGVNPARCARVAVPPLARQAKAMNDFQRCMQLQQELQYVG